MDTPHNKHPLLPRAWTIPLYLIEMAFIAYFVIGAAKGHLAISTKSGPLVVHGAVAWLCCLVPMSGLAITFAQVDPAKFLTLAARRRMVSVAIGLTCLAIVGIVAALVLGPRP